MFTTAYFMFLSSPWNAPMLRYSVVMVLLNIFLFLLSAERLFHHDALSQSRG